MHKAEINLLPPPALHTRHVRMYTDRIGKLQRLVLLMLLLMLASLAIIYAVYAVINIRLEQQLEAARANDTITIERINDTNRRLHAAQNWIRNAHTTSSLVPDILAAAPAGVVLNEISYDSELNVFTIRGTLNARSAVLAYQRVLEEVAWVERVEAPLSNFTTGADAEFTFTLYSKPTL